MSDSNEAKIKILLVDDEEQIVTMLKDTLVFMNYAVVTASDGHQAFELMKSEKISLVLSDIQMPQLSGLQLLSKARRQNFNMPFIFLTGNYKLDVVIEAVRLGASDFILKPFEIPELEKVVKRVAAISLRLEQIDELIYNLGQDVAPRTYAKINDLRRQINILRTMD